MRKLVSLTTDELWILHEEICDVLSSKLNAEKDELERRLAQLSEHRRKERRPYPKVVQKYRNPDRLSDTWSGRGKQPHWLSEQVRDGKKIADFLVSQPH
jgi:DNA-binding protein H-NS